MIEISQYLFYKLINLLNISTRNVNSSYITKIHLMEEGKLSQQIHIPIKH